MTGHMVVTDATGFIGSRLPDRLLADGHTDVGLDLLVQSHVCVLRLLATADIHMLPKMSLH